MKLRDAVKAGISNRDDFKLHPQLSALLIIDIQSYLSKPDDDEEIAYYGKESLPRTVKNIQKLIHAFRMGTYIILIISHVNILMFDFLHSSSLLLRLDVEVFVIIKYK